MVWLTALFVCRAVGKGSVLLLLWKTPRLSAVVDALEMLDGPEVYELLSGSCVACADGLVKGNGMSVLMGHMCCLLHLYL